MKVFYLIFIIFSLTYWGVSCTMPASNLPSETDDEDPDDEDDDRPARTCSDRDSCQDICDDMFNYTAERFNCYELSSDDVNSISLVWDEFSRKRISMSELEDLDADDVRAYLEIGLESLIDLINREPVGDGTTVAQWNVGTNDIANRKNAGENSRKILKWMAEEEDIAEVILEQDGELQLGLEIFKARINIPDVVSFLSQNTSGSGNDNGIRVSNNLNLCMTQGGVQNINYHGNTGNCKTAGRQLVNLTNTSQPEGFVSGFLSDITRSYSGDSRIFTNTTGDSFISFAADERNEKAFEWGHKTLLEFCKEGTDEDERDVDVKTCMQAIYCIHRTIDVTTPVGANVPLPRPGGGTQPSPLATGAYTTVPSGEGIFEDLEDYRDVVGSTDARRCGDLLNEDRMERLFD